MPHAFPGEEQNGREDPRPEHHSAAPQMTKCCPPVADQSAACPGRAGHTDQIVIDENLKARFDILVSIPGLSKITAYTLLIEMPELGELNEKAVGTLTGLAPSDSQSRRRFNPDFKANYDALRKAGKPPKVAINAIM